MQVLGRSCGSVPGVIASSGKGLKDTETSSVHFFAGGTKLGSLKHFSPTSCRLSSSSCLRHTRSPLYAKRWVAASQATSFQAVTGSNDSSSGDSVGSSAHSMNSCSEWPGREELKPFLVSSLQGFQEGIRRIRDRAVPENSKEVHTEVKAVDGKLALQDVSWSKVVTQGGRSWQTMQPWIKWPLTIFTPAFLVVLASFGLVVAQDLIPLWIIGPLVTGLIIRSAYWIAELAWNFAVSTEPLRQAAIRGTLQLYEDAKNGEVVDKLHALVELKRKEVKEDLAKRRSDFEVYVKSGQAATDFKDLMILRFSELTDWSTETYENFVEFMRPFWRAFSRLMKKLF